MYFTEDKKKVITFTFYLHYEKNVSSLDDWYFSADSYDLNG